MTDRLIICRAQISPHCLNGRSVAEHYEKPLYELDDGTYEPASMSVVCDPCYVDLMPLTPSGQALTHELDGAIAHAREYPGETCARCGKREGTVKWLRNGGTMAMAHGLYEMWCERCATRAQLRHALTRAVRIPVLAWRSLR